MKKGNGKIIIIVAIVAILVVVGVFLAITLTKEKEPVVDNPQNPQTPQEPQLPDGPANIEKPIVVTNVGTFVLQGGYVYYEPKDKVELAGLKVDAPANKDSLGALTTVKVDGKEYKGYKLDLKNIIVAGEYWVCSPTTVSSSIMFIDTAGDLHELLFLQDADNLEKSNATLYKHIKDFKNVTAFGDRECDKTGCFLNVKFKNGSTKKFYGSYKLPDDGFDDNFIGG